MFKTENAVLLNVGEKQNQSHDFIHNFRHIGQFSGNALNTKV